jgi:hypothetical protein
LSREQDVKKTEREVEAKRRMSELRPEKAPYQPPRIVKKRSVARASLQTGSGATPGGVLG